MDVEQLIDDTIEPQLETWLRKFPNAVEILKHIEDLFVGLTKTTVLTDVGKHVSISGPVHIGKGSKIHPFVKIQGPVIIGGDVNIRSHFIIRSHAYIDSKCVVGHSADVKRSICLSGAKMQCGIFVGDSILGCSASIGSGVILANRKFNQTVISFKDKEQKSHKSGLELFGL
jgi:NDP-sugar pyrophosphorylase family protein